MRLAFRRHLADQDISRTYLGADIYDAGLVELAQRALTDIRDIRGNLFGPEFDIARDAIEFFYMNAGVTFILD